MREREYLGKKAVIKKRLPLGVQIIKGIIGYKRQLRMHNIDDGGCFKYMKILDQRLIIIIIQEIII